MVDSNKLVVLLLVLAIFFSAISVVTTLYVLGFDVPSIRNSSPAIGDSNGNILLFVEGNARGAGN